MNMNMSKRIPALVLALLLALLPVTKARAGIFIDSAGGSIFSDPYLQSKGSMGVLVIPVQFADVRFSDDAESNLEQVFRGSGTKDAPSVKEYYAQASYDSLYMDVIVQKVVTLDKNREEYAKDPVKMITECLEYITNVRNVYLPSFDENADGRLDALYLVWAGEAGNAYSFWWPHTDNFFTNFSFRGLKINTCSYLSYEWLMNGTKIQQFSAIHETGHMLGLTDYYASTSVSGTLADTMMDRNAGDIDPFSKELLGWNAPIRVNASGTFEIGSSARTKDVLLLSAKDWDGNILGEYFLLEYVTPERNLSGLDIPSQGAVRIWHVNAQVSPYTSDITADMFRYHNRSGSDFKLLEILDPSRQFYSAGDEIGKEHFVLSSSMETGLSISIESLNGESASIRVYYAGDKPAQESSEPEESESSLEESSQETEASGEESGENSQETEGSSEGTEEDPSVNETGSAENSETESGTSQGAAVNDNGSGSSMADSAETSDAYGSIEESYERSSMVISVNSYDGNVPESQTGQVTPRKITVPAVIVIVLVICLCVYLAKDHSRPRRKRRSKRRY